MSLFGQARKLRHAMQEAQTYDDWFAAAEALDRVGHNDIWREDPTSKLYHYELLAEHLAKLRDLRETAQVGPLARTIQESLHRHLGEISSPDLYSHAHTGTKRLIGAYLEEVERAMRFICEHDTPSLPLEEKLQNFEQAAHNFGGTALILSGGLAFGIYHMGVIKALWEQRLLPTVISGSSMGAIVAAVTCTRTDAELAELFAHPERIHVDALKLASPAEIIRERKLLNSSPTHAVQPRSRAAEALHPLGRAGHLAANRHHPRSDPAEPGLRRGDR
ncbi:MAG: hypothetical protein AUK47_13025 [Deltaproteobacteria bacterium CG2_30_63_29]|nr:MAG: hypothetical protein AUK47_13025 [Deltaproteobacteria bacterium CG2_30_63_29]